MLRFLKNKIILATLIICSVASDGFSYAQSDQLFPRYDIDNVDCMDEEQVKAVLDYAILGAKADDTFIIIGRLGSGERSRNLNQRRLFAPSDYLVETRGISQSRVITAEGEKVRGRGQVEVYVGGKLFILFRMKRNRDFTSGCSYR